MFNLVSMFRGFNLRAVGGWLLSAFALMMQRSEFQENERILFLAENNPRYHKIPTRTGVMCTRSDFVLSGSLVISAGTTSGTSLGENPGNLALQTLRIDAARLSGSYPDGALVNLSPRTLARRRIFDHAERRFVGDPNNPLPGLTGAAGTFTLNYPIVKYWAINWLQRPFDTALDTGMYSQLLATLTQGSRDRQFSGNDRTFSYTGVFWEITHRFQRYDGNGNGPQAVIYDDDRVVLISGANSRLELNKEFPVDGAYTDLLFQTETTNQTLADTILNRATLKSGTEVFYDQYAGPIKVQMEEYIGDGSTTTTPRTGLYFAQIADDGLLPNSKVNISATLDVSNPGTDRLIVARRSAVNLNVVAPGKVQRGGGTVLAGN